ncbi:hypothetical protein IAT38_001994 [Cryptococcus sp. DSM 104549]
MRKLLIVWFFLDFLLLAAGVLSIVAAIMFANPGHLILNLIAQKVDFKIGLGLGATYLLGNLISIPAFTSNYEKPMMLKKFNWYLLVLSAITLAFGSIFWLLSLEQISTFLAVWTAQSAAAQQAFQDKFSCCGYTNGTLAGGFTTQAGFCADAVFAANQTGCQTTITASTNPGTDFTLENVFSAIYGFELIIWGLLLATVCVINERQLAVRFQRIDEKRGGGGFV